MHGAKIIHTGNEIITHIDHLWVRLASHSLISLTNCWCCCVRRRRDGHTYTDEYMLYKGFWNKDLINKVFYVKWGHTPLKRCLWLSVMGWGWFISRQVLINIEVHVCLFLYLLHIEYPTMYSTSKVRTYWVVHTNSEVFLFKVEVKFGLFGTSGFF